MQKHEVGEVTEGARPGCRVARRSSVNKVGEIDMGGLAWDVAVYLGKSGIYLDLRALG